MGWLSRALRAVGHLVPPWLPHGSAVGNRLLKPVYRSLYGSRLETVPVWNGLLMQVDPTEAIGGNLFFSPHLYDRLERGWMESLLPEGGVLLDVGANIGLYTLLGAARVGAAGRVVAVEADPDTFGALERNVRLNGFEGRVTLLDAGASDRRERLTFFRNTRGNRGANSFQPSTTNAPALELDLFPLEELVARAAVDRVDFLKMDIEGFELRVLRHYLEACRSRAPHLLPRHVMLELGLGPMGADPAYQEQLLGCLSAAGYAPVHTGANGLFALARPAGEDTLPAPVPGAVTR